MVPQWIIEAKRDGKVIPEKDLREFIRAYGDGGIPDYQMAAFAMAVLFRGMTFDETTTLTDAMMRSGDMLDLSAMPRPTVDKHSSGGVGDKISIPLAPLVAASGAIVPMISGRGLGITGGTNDKLESIPGYSVSLPESKFMRNLRDIGCSIIGQTARLAPVDKKLYALRDVTGTVPSIPLICASIMSKKLAEGSRSLMLDVKCGEGAFMKTRKEAKALAEIMSAVGRNMGRNMSAFVTDMNEPLGQAVGNALEIRESVAILQGEGPKDATGLTVALGGQMLVMAGIAKNRREGEKIIRAKIASGEGFERFVRMVRAHGGDAKCIINPDKLPAAPCIVDVPAPRSGHIAYVNADAIGRVVLELGGGRRQVTDAIDPSVGIDRLLKAGAKVAKGESIMRIHARSKEDAEYAKRNALAAVAISSRKKEVSDSLILECL